MFSRRKSEREHNEMKKRKFSSEMRKKMNAEEDSPFLQLAVAHNSNDAATRLSFK